MRYIKGRKRMKKIKNPAIYRAIKAFLTEYLPVIRQKSQNTIDSYKDTINLFLLFLQANYKLRLSDITVDYFSSANIVLFMDWLASQRGNSVTTVNQRMTGIRQFCKYLVKRGLIDFSDYAEMQGISKVADLRKNELTYLTIEEMRLIMSCPDVHSKAGLRDKFYIGLLYDSGCRNQEILDLAVRDFVVIKSGEAELHIIGKGNKYRVTPISTDVVRLFEEYRTVFHGDDSTEEHLFYTRRNGIIAKMSQDNVARILKKYETEAKKVAPSLPHLHAHIFRHTRAMHLYSAGVPLPLVSEWLGHSQMETTQMYYARATTDMKRKAVEKVTSAATSVFTDEKFLYANNDDMIKKLYGLA